MRELMICNRVSILLLISLFWAWLRNCYIALQPCISWGCVGAEGRVAQVSLRRSRGENNKVFSLMISSIFGGLDRALRVLFNHNQSRYAAVSREATVARGEGPWLLPS